MTTTLKILVKKNKTQNIFSMKLFQFPHFKYWFIV